MLIVLSCDECGNDKGSGSYELTWCYGYRTCPLCKDSKRDEITYRFCSEKCLGKFVKRFVNHKHKWAVSENMSSIVKKDDGSHEVMKVCSICRRMQWFVANKMQIKKRKEALKKYGITETE